MATFDENFQKLQQPFHEKFKKSWSDDPALFLQYVQAEYSHTIADLMHKGLNQVLNNQRDIKDIMQSISKNLDK